MSPTLSLYELNSLVRRTIETTLSREYWVEAELSECRESRGHCYMELVEKDELNNTPIARASAKCWRSQWLMIQPHFERVTGQRLHAGMKVRLKVYAQFHEAYGFSWIVTDIDPTFTLGDLARRRQEIIRQLKEEGVFDLQKELSLPLFCLNIAVISSETAAGYGDFCRQLADSPFAFLTQLFPATMQGEQVEQSIIAALNQIWWKMEGGGRKENTPTPQSFDCVVITRGGGATADMSGFDTLALAENVAQFPLPVITGIGHDRDECVLDMVSHARVKTPTAAAQLLIDRAQQVDERIATAEQRLGLLAQSRLAQTRSRLDLLSQRLPSLFSVVSTRQQAFLLQQEQRLCSLIAARQEREQSHLTVLGSQLHAAIQQRLTTAQHRLELLQQRTSSLDPALLLKRGYSITLLNGKALRSAAALRPGDRIETRLSEGTVCSEVLPQ